MRVTKNPLALIGAILLAISALVSLDNVVSAAGTLGWLGDPNNTFVLPTLIDLLSSFIVTFGSLGIAIWAFLAKTPKPLGIASLLLFVLGPLAALVIDIFWLTQGSSFGDAFFQAYGGAPRIAAASAVFTALLGSALLVIAGFTAKPTPEIAVANRFDPMTGQPIVAPVAAPAGAGAQSNLPMISLILAFFVPLAAVIVGHISLNQMKQGLISSANQGMAKTGVILGYVFIGLGFLFGIIFAVVYASILSRQYY